MKKLLLFVACAIIAMSCTDDQKKSKLSPSEMELKFLKTQQINTDGAAASNWSSSDTYVASVSNDGLVTAMHIGQAVISATVDGKKQTCKVTVTPTFNSFLEPFTDWGASKANIKQKEKRTLESEDDETLTYKEPRTNGLLYLFENDKLTVSGVVLPLLFDPEELVTFLSERHTVKGEIEDFFVWSSNDGKSVIIVKVETIGTLIAYGPMTDGAASSVQELMQLTRDLRLSPAAAGAGAAADVAQVKATISNAINAK